MKKIGLLLAIVISIGCTTQYGLVHTIESKSGSPIVVESYGDSTITIEPFTEDTWTRIAEGRFIDRSKVGRLPKIPFFLIVIQNKTNHPILIKEIALVYNNTKNAVLSINELKEYLASPAYEFIKLEELTTPQRVVSYSEIKKIDFAHDVIPFTLGFIPSGDTQCRIVAGKWIPVNVREFSVEIIIKTPAEEKTIDCNFVRKEFRTKGEHFLK